MYFEPSPKSLTGYLTYIKSHWFIASFTYFLTLIMFLRGKDGLHISPTEKMSKKDCLVHTHTDRHTAGAQALSSSPALLNGWS
jgi:hypothetical protein